MRHSPAAQINRENVSRLQVAWTFHTGDLADGSTTKRRSGFESTPILVDGTLYFTTPFNRIIALDPETGKQRWAFDPHIDITEDYGHGLVNRGVATWLDGRSPEGGQCRRRIFEATLDARLVAVDAANGTPCSDFGTNGQVSLRNVAGYRSGWYHMTSPPAVVGDIVVVGSAIVDNYQADMPSGVVRAFDARSGALRWSWDPIPRNADDTGNRNGSAKGWRSGAANAWSIMAVDRSRDLVFIPTGSASPDYYGGLRPGDNKWANSVVALRGKTGELVWGFQLVHHDLWDYDTASPPLLTTLRRGGRNIDVVVQGNKTGFLYVLDRETGTPFFPVEERPVPQSTVPGEVTSPTQPIPVMPPALTPQHLSVEDMWGLDPAQREACRSLIRTIRHDGLFAPPDPRGTLEVPGNIGGMNWSGYAFDPERSLLVVNTTNLPFVVTLRPKDGGDGAAPDGEEHFLQTGAPYSALRRPFFGASQLPCSPPPWGVLTAVDMAQGTIRWQVPLGSPHDGSERQGLPEGSPSLGGPILTATGLVFIAGTPDPYIRAFDVETGQVLWKARLPAGGHATPMTYRLANGRQYVVIAAGGHALIGTEAQSDTLVAFALP